MGGGRSLAAPSQLLPSPSVVLESNGQIDFGNQSYGGAACAFVPRLHVASVRNIADESWESTLQRPDAAVAMAFSACVAFDEVCGLTGEPAMLTRKTSGNSRRTPSQYPIIDIFIAGGGSLALGDCKPASGVALHGSKIIVALAGVPDDTIESILDRLDNRIEIAQRTGQVSMNYFWMDASDTRVAHYSPV